MLAHLHREQPFDGAPAPGRISAAIPRRRGKENFKRGSNSGRVVCAVYTLVVVGGGYVGENRRVERATDRGGSGRRGHGVGLVAHTTSQHSSPRHRHIFGLGGRSG